jgi:hypothetical protein
MDFLRGVAFTIFFSTLFVVIVVGAVFGIVAYGVGRFVCGWWKWRHVRRYRRAFRDARFLSLKDGDVQHPSAGRKDA